MNEVVRFDTLGGQWEVGGIDRRSGIWPEDLSCSWDDWGPKTARFTLKRLPGVTYPDLQGLTPVIIEKGRGVWEGFIDQTPQIDENSLGVECIGWPDHANDILSRRLFIHENLSDWQDWRSSLAADLTKFKTSFNVTVGDGGIVINGPTVADGSFPRGGVYIDLGPSLTLGREATAKRMVVEWEKNQWTATATAYYSVGDTPQDLDGGSNSIVTVSDASTSGTFAATLADNYRYVRIHVDTSAAQATDRFFRIKAIRLFNLTAYESGNQSVLTTSTILKNIFSTMVPEWKQDTTGISTTTFVIPSLVLNDLRTFREIVETLNGLHGYIRKLRRDTTFVFEPRPMVPLYSAGSWPGISFRDQSKNATRDLYNIGVAVGQTPDGIPLLSRRHAGQATTGFPGTTISSFSNPSFDTNTTGWTPSASTTITRSTSTFHTSPGSGVWQRAGTNLAYGDNLTTVLPNAFEADTAYRISFWAKSSSTLAVTGLSVQIGLSNDVVFQPISHPGGASGGAFQKYQFVWAPKSAIPTNQAHLDFVEYALAGSPAGIVLDTFIIEVVKPTLLDLRGRERDKVISMPSQAVSTEVLDRFADVWLQSHMQTQSKGTLEVQGRALQQHNNGTPIDPFEIGEHTGEMVCLLSEIDPDGGAIGRNIPISDVNYEGNTETASLSLDSTNEDFERVVARYEMLVSHLSIGRGGGGSLS